MLNKNPDKIEVSRIEIKIGAKTLSLTLAEAYELRDILAGAFPKYAPPAPAWRDTYIPHPWTVPFYTQPAPRYNKWESTCGGQSGTAGNVMQLSTTSVC